MSEVCDGRRLCAWWCLPAIVCAAAVVRLIGPLTSAALGQTDAYAHLQFVNDIVEQGALRHPFYPPGYHWLLAVPACLWGWDTYWIVRYGGVVFGVGLVLTTMVLAKRAFGERAACWSGFLVAAFPAFHWLQKTGVGAFPSQLGLMLVPLLLLGWDRLFLDFRRTVLWWIALCAWLALAVPIMLFDVLAFLAFDALIRILRRELPRAGYYALALVSGGMAAIWFAFTMDGGAAHVGSVIPMVTGLSPDDVSGSYAGWVILWSYIAPQRLTLAYGVANMAAWGVGAALCLGLWALWSSGSVARMIGSWGCFVWAQTVFGVFQFGPYMRAGWFLLIALALWGGYVVSTWMPRLPIWGRRVVCTALIAPAFAALWYPPAPQPHLSPAEEDLVRVLRKVDRWARNGGDSVSVAWLDALPQHADVSVWSRAFNAFPLHQGDPVYAFLERTPRIDIHTGTEAIIPHTASLDPGRTHLILLDDRVAPQTAYGLMMLVNPGLVSDFRSMQSGLLAVNQELRSLVREAEASGRRVTRFDMPHGLDIVIVSQSP